MKFTQYTFSAVAGLVLAFGATAQDVPPAAAIEVDFVQHIKPIFEARCFECHGPEKQKSGLRMDIQADLMKGGSEGPAMTAGDGANSLMVQLLLGANEDFDRMPPEGDPLTPEQIGLIRAWIDQGIKWNDTAAPAAAVAEAHPEKAMVEALGNAWKVEATHQEGPLATWEVSTSIPAPDAGAQVIALTAPNHKAGATYNLLWSPVKKFLNGAISAKVKAISGEEDQGGGLIWRARNKDNYYVARYNPLEKNLRLYRVVEANRDQIASADIEVPADQWAELTITHQDNLITCSLNGQKLIEATDDAHLKPGGIGYWTKADAATAFTEIAVTQ
ncbi:MAG: hypothetical protein HYV27_22830 [Candidatus Hydrogenedentes bacterium]|nr:hypothetical protein [Candidatus Hydrogenedentota bacterium]